MWYVYRILSNISNPFRRNATVEAAVTVCLHSDWDGNHRLAPRMGIVESGCGERGAPNLQCRRLPSFEVVSNGLLELGRVSSQIGDSPSGDVVNTAQLKREPPYGFKRN